MAAVLDRDANGNVIRKAGIMGVVLAGGEVRAGNPIWVALQALCERGLGRE
jgi:MOSC domain-containing protein YiiM